ncbi:MAG: ATP-grasp domain-containing protein [Deltaproteobacteria bacterium]|nr:MAG: ATP-grasp domain-containing protein [Deltaproteobacteria bacterium]
MSLTIAVTGMNATDNPGPGVAVIRAIRDACPDCTIVGLAYETLDPGNFMPGIADHAYLLPYPSMGADALSDRLLAIHALTPIDVLVPTLDAELPVWVRLEGLLAAHGIRTFLPDADGLALRNKDRLHELADLGVSVPKSMVLTDPNSISKVADELGYPVVVKGRFYDAYVAQNAHDVAHWFHKLANSWGLPVIIQKFVPGTEFDVVCVGDGEGGLIGSVAMRKMQLTDKGKAWGGVTVRDRKLEAFVQDTVRALSWRGPCELEVMRGDDGGLYLIEINPRFPAWVYLSAGAGRNLPWAAVELALGREVAPMPPAPAGVMFLRHSVDQILPLSDFEALTVHGEIHREPIPDPEVADAARPAAAPAPALMAAPPADFNALATFPTEFPA